MQRCLCKRTLTLLQLCDTTTLGATVACLHVWPPANLANLRGAVWQPGMPPAPHLRVQEP